MWKPPIKSYAEELREAIGECSTLLDVGCGALSPIHSFSKAFRSTGVDGFAPSIQKSRALGIHQDYIQMNLLDIGKRFAPGSFDVVLASDVIEHFEKPEGERLLQMMEKIAKRRVVLFTPNGFLPQGEYDNNPHQLHVSGWSAQEMREHGYRVIGIRGWRPLRGERCEPRFRPKRLCVYLSDLTQVWTHDHPDHAFQILCVKETHSVPAALSPVSR